MKLKMNKKIPKYLIKAFLILSIPLQNLTAKNVQIGELKFPASKKTPLRGEYNEWLQVSRVIDAHKSFISPKEDQIEKLKKELILESYYRSIFLAGIPSNMQPPSKTHQGISKYLNGITPIQQKIIDETAKAQVISFPQFEKINQIQGEIDSYVIEHNLKDFIQTAIALNKDFNLYRRDQFTSSKNPTISHGRTILRESPTILYETAKCSKYENIEKMKSCYNRIHNEYNLKKVNLLKYEIINDLKTNQIFKKYLTSNNDELKSAYYIIKDIQSIEDDLRCLKDTPSRFSNCVGKLNRKLQKYGLTDFLVPSSGNAKAIEMTKGLLKRMRKVFDFFSQGTINQFISRSCQKDLLKSRYPKLKIGEVITNPKNPNPSVSSYLAGYAVAYGESFNKNSECPKEKYLFPYRNNEERVLLGGDEVNPPYDYEYDNKSSILSAFEFQRIDALEKEKEIDQIKDQMILQVIGCGDETISHKSIKDKNDCRDKFENRMYKICDNKAYNRVSEDVCTECNKIEGLPEDVLDILTGTRSSVRAAISNINDPNNLTTFHYKYLMRGIGINDRLKNFCQVYGVSLREIDFPESCSGGMYDLMKKNITNCDTEHPKEDGLDNILKSTAKQIKKQIEDINKQEKKYVKMADEVEKSLRDPKLCRTLMSSETYDSMSTLESIGWAEAAALFCGLQQVASIPSRIKNSFNGLKNDYTRYLKTGNEIFLERYVNSMGVIIAGKWSKKDKDQLKNKIKSEVSGAFERYRRKSGVDLISMRQKIYHQKRYAQSLILSNPILATDLLGEDRASSVSEDGVTLLPAIDKFKLLNRFSKQNTNTSVLIEESIRNARTQAKLDLHNVCTADLVALVKDESINKKALKLFPNINEMDQCIKEKIKFKEDVYSDIATGFMMIGGLGVCTMGSTACIAGGLTLGVGYTGYQWSQGLKKLDDATSCNITNGNLNDSCNAQVLDSLSQEVALNRASFFAFEIPSAISEVFPLKKLFKITMKMVVEPKKASGGVKSYHKSIKKLGVIKKESKKLLKSNRVIINRELETTLKSLSNMPFSQRIHHSNRLKESLSNSENLDSLFLLSTRRQFPNVTIPDSYLNDILSLSDNKRIQMIEKIGGAKSKEEILRAFKEIEMVRDVQKRLEKELGRGKAHTKYGCLF